MGDHAELLLGDAELGEHLAATLAVHDDAFEPGEDPPPQLGLRGRPPRQEVVRRQHERGAVAEEPAVELRRQPLHVDDVGGHARESRQSERVLERLCRQPQPRATEDP